MKINLRALMAAALALVVVSSAHAATYSNFLNDVQANLQGLFAATDEGGPAENAQAHKMLGKALNAFDRDSTSIAGDYGIFISATTAVLPLQGAPGTESLSQSLSNAFTAFVQEAQYEILVLSNRVANITPFQKSRVAASNNVQQAQNALNAVFLTTNVNVAILSVRLAYTKITVAAKLTAKAESKQGDAPNSLSGGELTHTEPGDNGTPSTHTISFTDGSNYTENDPENPSGTYSYERTGLDTGTLTLHPVNGGTITVQLKFTSRTSGTFKFHFEEGADEDSGKGTFTYAD